MKKRIQELEMENMKIKANQETNEERQWLSKMEIDMLKKEIASSKQHFDWEIATKDKEILNTTSSVNAG